MTGHCKINNVTVQFTADTGAEKSVICQSVLQQTGATINESNPRYILKDASANQMHVVGEATVQLQLGDGKPAGVDPSCDWASGSCGAMNNPGPTSGLLIVPLSPALRQAGGTGCSFIDAGELGPVELDKGRGGRGATAA